MCVSVAARKGVHEFTHAAGRGDLGWFFCRGMYSCRRAGGARAQAPIQQFAAVSRADRKTDAIAMRNVLFDALPSLESAVLRAFRQAVREPPEMLILGTVSREMPAVHRVSSLVMRAKLFGFCFCFEDGLLRPLQVADRSEEFIT